MATPEIVTCDMDSCAHNDSGECACEELNISDEKECASYERRRRA